MIREYIQYIAVAFVAVCLASALVAGFHVRLTTNVPTATDAIDSTLQEGEPDPTLQVVMERRNVTTNNSTSFFAYVGNPHGSGRAMYVMVQIRIDASDRDLPALVNEERGTKFDDHLFWQFDYDLAPGQYRLVNGMIGRHADPGTYTIEIDATYWKDDALTSQSSNESLFVRSIDVSQDGDGQDRIPNGDSDSGPSVIQLVVDFVFEYPGVTGVIIGIIGLLVTIIESDRIRAGLGHVWRWAWSNDE